jgi:cytochrome b6-f complex iron-sulfur subunit
MGDSSSMETTRSGFSKGRRTFLWLTGVIGLGWVAAAVYPFYKYISPRPAPDPFGEEGRAAVKDVAPAQVANPGTGANGSYGQRGCVVFRDAGGELRALDAKCTHAGCNVNFGGDKITCHCHGGVYDLSGKNIAGPPPRPLTPLRAFEENGVIYVAPVEPGTEA